MKRKQYINIEVVWRWCPVCMSNQYHERVNEELVCSNPNHQYYLKYRTDNWVKKLKEWKELRQAFR